MGLLSDPDFQMNLLSEGIGVITETILIVVILANYLKYKENKKWKPARMVVALDLAEAHHCIFGSAATIFNRNFSVDLKSHGFPAGTTQEKADTWGREMCSNMIKPSLDKLKKTIEYNNACLDSEILPHISRFIDAAESVISKIEFIKTGFNKKDGNYSYIPPEKDILTMESSYKHIVKKFPEAKTGRTRNEPFTPPSAEKIINLLIDCSNEDYFSIIKRENIEKEKRRGLWRKILRLN